MALKDWLDTGKCLMGFHDGDWARGDPKSCVLIQTCSRCNAINRRVEHDWAEWNYLLSQACDLARSCRRCADKETRVEHQWGNWSYRQEKACEQGIQCLRCSAWNEDKRVEHDWGDWEYHEQHRAPLHRCGRCALLASPFPDQIIDAIGAAGDDESSLGSVQELLSDDKAVEDMLRRAQERAGSEAAAPQAKEPSNDADNWQQQGVKALRQLYEEQTRTGVIAPERRPLLNSILSELNGVIGKPAANLADKQIKARRLQDAMLRLNEALLDPSREARVQQPVAGTRLALIAELHRALHRYVYTETAGGTLTGEEGQTGLGLLGQLHDSREAIAKLSPDGDPLTMECESLRRSALDIRNFSLRHHLTLIDPIWPTQNVAQNPGAVFYSGGARVGAWLERFCASRNLHRLIPQATGEPASLRWNQMREAALAVFDFTGFNRNASLDEASASATVAYEVGIALALGRPAVIVALENQELPFDLDIQPIRVHSSDDAIDALGLALDRNLYAVQRGRAGTSIAESIEYLRGSYFEHSDFRVRQTLASIDDDAGRDPVKVRLLIASLLAFVGAKGPQIALSTWPGSYPNLAAKRCFHVTAFGPTWSNSISQIVKQTCGINIAYIRGDQVLAPDILRSIWDELCRATHIVVDLTGLNANVVLELGIAHTLGRNILLISQDQQPEKYFRAIAKQRIHSYGVSGDGRIADLQSHLQQFLK